MAAASRFLTPVLLELGGKSPVYVDKDCSLATICKRIAWGKVFNGGQTCVAPDYVMVHQDIAVQFKAETVKAFRELFGDPSVYNDQVAKIINQRQFERLSRVITNSGGTVLVDGFRDPERMWIGPTIIDNPNLDSELMTDEIFGPVLPIVTISNHEEAINSINAHEKPLSCYVMTSNSAIQADFRNKTSSGSLVYNDCVFQVSGEDIPFGGVGNSGMGQYHSKTGFKTCSHLKPVVSHGTLIDLTSRSVRLF